MANHRRPSRSLASLVCKMPANPSAENQLAPFCESDAKTQLGAWKPAQILIDHIALEAGFSKQAYQAQCFTMDDVKYVHVKKNAPWFIAAVGGPQAKKSSMPSVQVIDLLYSKVFGKEFKHITHESEDRSRGEDLDNEDEFADDDPIAQLFECAPDIELETPKKKKQHAKMQLPRTTMREIDMPKRPLCVGGSANETRIVHMYVRPNSKSLWLRIDCVDWLVSYAADEHYYQGISRVDDTSAPATDYCIQGDYNEKFFDCTINVGTNAGFVLRFYLNKLTKEVFEKLNELNRLQEYWSKANTSVKRTYCRQYLEKWCVATISGTMDKFEDEWGGEINVDKNTQDER